MNRLLIPLLALLLAACTDGKKTGKVLNLAGSPIDTTGYVLRSFSPAAFHSLYVDGISTVRFNPEPSAARRVEVRVHPDYADSLNVAVSDSTLRLAMNGTARAELNERESLKPYYIATLYGPMPRTVTLAGAGELQLDQWKSQDSLTLHLKGATDITATLVETPALTLDLSGTGTIRFPSVAVGRLDVSVSGVGTVSLGGTAQEARFDISGAGSVDARGLSVAGAVSKQVSGIGTIDISQ